MKTSDSHPLICCAKPCTDGIRKRAADLGDSSTSVTRDVPLNKPENIHGVILVEGTSKVNVCKRLTETTSHFGPQTCMMTMILLQGIVRVLAESSLSLKTLVQES